MQRLHLVGLLGPTLESGFVLVASYGSGHYGRFLKNLGRVPRLLLILGAPHCPTAASLARVRLHPYYGTGRGQAHRPKEYN